MIRFLSAVLFALVALADLRATDYYISTSGNDANPGTSPASPWATLGAITTHATFAADDTINFKRGDVWSGLTVGAVFVANGTSWTHPVIVRSYSTGALPKFTMTDVSGETVLRVNNPDYLQIQDLEFNHMDNGIVVFWSTFGHTGLHVSGIYAHDFTVNSVPGAGLPVSQAVLLGGTMTSLPTSSQWVCKDLRVENCTCINGAEAIDFVHVIPSGPGPLANQYSFQGGLVAGNFIDTMAQDGTIMTSNTGVSIIGNRFYNTATHNKTDGSDTSWNLAVQGINYANNLYDTLSDTASPDMAGIIFEAFADGQRVAGNFFISYPGTAIEMLQIDTFGGNAGTVYITNTNAFGNVGVNIGYAVIQPENFKPGFCHFDYAHGVPMTGVINNSLYNTASGADYTWAGALPSATFTNDIAIGTTHVFNAGYQISGTQGTNGWGYQYFDGSTWSNLTSYDSFSRRWTSGSTDGQVGFGCLLPDSTASHKVALTWTSPGYGLIAIRGWVLRQQLDGSTTTAAAITINQTGHLWPIGTSTQTIAAGDTTGYAAQLTWIPINAGDVLRFEVSSPSGGQSNALTSWNPSIVFTSYSGSQQIYSFP